MHSSNIAGLYYPCYSIETNILFLNKYEEEIMLCFVGNT